MKVSNLIMVIVLFSSVLVVAQEQNKEGSPPSKVNFTLGLAVGTSPQYEGSKDYRVMPGVAFSVDWNTGQYIRLAGLGINANLITSKKWEVGPRLGFMLPRNDDFVDDKELNALKVIDFALSVGAFAKYKFAKGFDMEFSYTQDVTGANDGGLGGLEIGYSWRKKRFINRISVSSSYATSNYMNTYFAVNQDNRGASTLENYSLNGGIKDVGVGFTSIYAFNQKWLLVGRLGYNVLLGEVADSPIVELGSTNQFSTGLALTYRF